MELRPPRQPRQQPHPHQQPQRAQPQTLPQPIRPPPTTQTSSLSSSLASQQSSTMLQAQNAQAHVFSAPLPSPSAAQPASYFGSLGPQQQQQQPPPPPTSHPTQQQQSTPQPPASERFMGQRGDGGGIPETATFLKEFNLVAEAAKRAQMACLTRDLGDVGL